VDEALEQLLGSYRLWRGSEGAVREGEAGRVAATGYSRLDACLPGGGWPLASLTEALSGACGIGELRLFMPALSALCRQREGWVVWIAPPHVPYAPALMQWGLEVSRVLLIHPAGDQEALWAMEQALSSGTCVAVLAWINRMDERTSRRLQLAAGRGESWAIAFRPAAARREASAAALRLMLRPGSNGTDVDLFKVRGARPALVSDYDGRDGSCPLPLMRPPGEGLTEVTGAVGVGERAGSG